ncbi:Kelch motif family protein [Tritrichomonas foetus]|uniref:Kelch motif family protein n=1 Tax=Tritrichomonas foetus TaxID=1144522 RepID=A0A1J4K3E1_9EUKA|nr:Kelch motif family protein [Tritrichomonas foetus]|eukprot:OHT05352.1 Kelch motif family protein [Tritrichomonas foetus]
MSYCPSISPGWQDFLPGISSIADGRRTSYARSPQAVSSINSQFDGSLPLPFSSLWSVVPTTGESPSSRSGQTVIYWPEENSIISCYGRNPDDTFSKAFWKFSIHDQKWEKLPIKKVKPRAACGSAIIGNKLRFFGGITSSQFVSDLHYIDLDTCECVYPVTTGESPPACALPLVAYYHPYLIVWGGTSGTNLSNFHRLNVVENHWERINTEFVGRQGACGAIIGSSLFIFGASSPMSILELDLTSFTFSLVPTTGIEPPHGLECLTTVAVGSTCMAFETIGLTSKTKLYVFDTDRYNWMCYSVPLSDESDKECTPKLIFYLPYDRKLVALCEGDGTSSNPLTELNIGRSIATLNQRLDLLSML